MVNYGSIIPNIQMSVKYNPILEEMMPKAISKLTTAEVERAAELPVELSKILFVLRKYDTTFLEFVIGLFSQVKLQMKPDGDVDVFQTLSNLGPVVYRDMEFSSEDIQEYLKLFRKYSFGEITSMTQIKSKFNCAVPLMLYAHKLYNNVPYSRWFSGGKNSTVLGKALGTLCILETRADISDIDNLRFRMVTGKQGDGEKIYSFSGYKCNKTGNDEWDALPKIYRMMEGQLWIFNSQHRNENMILNWWDWDNIPEPFDAKYSIEKQAKIRVKQDFSDPNVPF